jgi:hypothetical protein
MPRALDPNLPWRRVYFDIDSARYDALMALVRERGVTLKRYLNDIVQAHLEAQTPKGKRK